MIEGHVPPPERNVREGPRVVWDAPPVRQPSTTVPRWAVAALVIGVACSLVVAKMSYDYFGKGEPWLAMAYMFEEIPFFAVGVPLMLYGALGVARPRTARRPLLGTLIVMGVVAWWYLVLDGPRLLV
jgi:hypothetical protein